METITTYKLLRFEGDGLHPLFIDAGRVLPIAEWIEAQAPDDLALQYVPTGFALIDMVNQRSVTYQQRRPRPNQVRASGRYRQRWVEVVEGKRGHKVYDIGLTSEGRVTRFAHRPGWHSSAAPTLPCVNMEGKVWAECLIPADDYYIHRVNVSGLTKHHEPLEWYISQKIFITRLIESPQTNNVESTKAGM